MPDDPANLSLPTHQHVDQYVGLLVVGDPHLEGRTPGFRRDNYPEVILEKFAWCLRYAQANRLLPTLLGDLFDKPRDNPTWMLGSLIDLLSGVECIGIYGNHDCAEPQLTDHDSLSLLVKAGRLRLLDNKPWRGRMNGRAVIIGGSSYRQAIPESFAVEEDAAQECADTTQTPRPTPPLRPLVFWLTHHDVIVPGYEEQGRLEARSIDRVDLVINGHIHRRLGDVQRDQTLWITPGNISRRTRSDASRDHVPSVLRIDIGSDGYDRRIIEVPHQPFDDVFHPELADAAARSHAGSSAFVAGLRELQARRTEGGAGLMSFLEKNLPQFDGDVAAEIRRLAKEVTDDGDE
jgi:DNA repair exonuclease SbcCD nuclease subunit